MNANATDHRSSDGRTPTSFWLLRNPIDFIAEDHLRLRAMCAEMDRLADAKEIQQDALTELQEYLTNELPALLSDEDEGLMPLLQKRAEREDELPKLARRFDRERREIDRLLSIAVAALAALCLGRDFSADYRSILHSLADATRRHLILENAILLPLARVRLTEIDLVELRQAMLRRRGLQDVFES